MILLKLSANKPSFKTIEFNESGVTFILGKKESPDSTNSKKTYNAVGKSLAIRLLHFCLGSNKSAEFEKKLPDWEFSLKFRINEEEFVAKRDTSNQSKIFLNDEELGVTAFREKLYEKIFNHAEGLPISFRSLTKRFIRSTKAAYNYAEIPDPNETKKEYRRLANNAFLLGLDLSLIKEKYDFKKELDYVKGQKKNIENDPILNSFYTGDKDIDIELEYLEQQITDLEANLQSLNIADDYHEIRQSADDTAYEIARLENQRGLIEVSISNISESLKVKSDLTKTQVETIFNEAEIYFESKLSKTLDEVLDFQKKLITNRVERLGKEKERLNNELSATNKLISEKGKILNNNLKYLKEHKALDEFMSLNEKLSDLTAKAQKFKDYRQLLKEYDLRKQQLRIDLTQSHIDAQKYLDSNTKLIHKCQKLFMSLAQRFYENKPAGISIVNNEGENQVRFNINSKIQSDTSDGVNEVKIFCYDFTLMMLKHNHIMNFIVHDSRLFSDMDPRQRAVAFSLAKELTASINGQYIATINEDQLLSLQDELEVDEYRYLCTRVKLELTDKSPESKLLGIDVDLDYEK